MTEFKISSAAAIVIVGAVASFMIHHQSRAKFRAGEALLQEQSNQLAALTAEQERLAKLASHATATRADDTAAELARLRSEAEALKQQTNHPGRPLEMSHTPRLSSAAASLESSPMEIEESVRQERIRQGTDARDLGYAFLLYANDHQNQSPLNLDQLGPYLAKLQANANSALSGTHQFEIIYQGSLDRLEGIPFGSVAVVRSRQIWPGQGGKMSRVYGFADGHSQTVGSDDNFQSWEAQHVIAPPPTGASGP